MRQTHSTDAGGHIEPACSPLKYVNHDIVFQEFPDEITLAVNLSCCPHRCPGCHSSYLQHDVGELLTWERLSALLQRYAQSITCVGLMGGDNNPCAIAALFKKVKETFPHLKTGWYSGMRDCPKDFDKSVTDYIKLGPYQVDKGPLNCTTTNQRLYFIKNQQMKDITSIFWKK